MKYLFLFLLSPFIPCAQDSLLQADLSPYVYYFEIKQDEFTGGGAEFLLKEANNNQYILLGEYHGSPRISEFTEAMIPILAKAGFEYFALEIGRESAKILSELSAEPQSTVGQMRQFNQKYNVIEADGTIFSAIPFFESVEDAQFLATAAENKMNLLGLDQEFCYAYLPLIDRMFDNLPSRRQSQVKALYQQARDSVLYFYKQDDQDIKRLSYSLRSSELFETFLNEASDQYIENREIASLIRKTTEIYYYNASRKYLKCNRTRIEHMKENLRKGMEDHSFDLKKDKLFLKMGGIHTARGFSWLSLYEIGNTLSELAAFQGNQSLHMSFSTRYYVEDGKVVDALADKEAYLYRYVDFLQFAKKDKWTIIDLRPLRQLVFYNRKYKLKAFLEDMFKQHDLLIIPALDGEGTSNY